MLRTRLSPPAFDRNPGDIVDLGLVALTVVAAAAGALTGVWWLSIVFAFGSLVAEIGRGPRPQRLRRLARRVLLDRPGRSLLRLGAVVVAVITAVPGVAFIDLLALLVAVMLLHLALVLYAALGQRRQSADAAGMTWRNLVVVGAAAGAAASAEGPPPFPDAVGATVPIGGVRLLAVTELLLLAGAVCIGLGVPVVAVVLAAVAVLIAALVSASALRAWGPHGNVPPRNTDAAVVAAVQALAPEVVFYFSSPASGTYALTVWADVINAMRVPTLVVLREAVHLEALDRIEAPIVVATSVADLERITVPSVRVVLYSTNVVRNNEMIRIPGPMHSFIGHGDSDKVGSFSPLNRMYDEIWVAGEAAIDRYRAVDEGIDLRGLRAVGRPQLAEIRRAAPDAARSPRLTVLYAPTWEGFFDEADYSSVAAMGERIAAGVLASGARLLFKPHPLTGHRLAEAGRARVAIEALVSQAGDGSAVLPNRPDALYTAFNEADLLITDISSVITDFLASRKPYAVSNRRDVSAEEFTATFPSSGAAELLGSDLGGLDAALDDAAGADTHGAARQLLATRLLGDQHDPLGAFLDEVDLFIGRSAARLQPVVHA